MIEYERILEMTLPKGQSAFLWGARKTGKTFYLKRHFPNSIVYDLLNSDAYYHYLTTPEDLRKEILTLSAEELEAPIIIDEIQQVPQLLNEVHWLIENTQAYFILCGSSARKLKRTGANLLGGRAWRYQFYPLTSAEIPNFDLQKALNYGLIPSHYDAINWKKTIKAYISDYLTHEVKAEGLVRNLTAFANFLQIAAHSNGEMINAKNIAQDCHVDTKTVKEYYQILEDTLIGYFLPPYAKKNKRKNLVATPKFYYFDVGVINGLTHREISAFQGTNAGAAFEHFIFMELIAYKNLNDLDFDITFWRTHTGLEVDFVLGDAEVGIEVKVGRNVRKPHIHGLIEFKATESPKKSIVVCNVPRRRIFDTGDLQDIILMPYAEFLDLLWKGEII